MPAPLALAIGGIILLGVSACGGRSGERPDGSPAPMGAVSTVDGEQVASGGGSMDLETLLRGKAPGLQVISAADGSYTFRIRGLNTANAGQQPLILVDGMEIRPDHLRSALAGLTRDDIEKVEVLRDVASTSMYGMKGAGGVIIITTNR